MAGRQLRKAGDLLDKTESDPEPAGKRWPREGR